MTRPQSGAPLRVHHALRDSLWLVPLLCLVAGIGLCFAAAAVDRAAGTALVPESITGSATAAQTVLSTVVTSMVTLITLVLTVVTVAVQLAMGQFSPRIVGALLRDRGASSPTACSRPPWSTRCSPSPGWTTSRPAAPATSPGSP